MRGKGVGLGQEIGVGSAIGDLAAGRADVARATHLQATAHGLRHLPGGSLQHHAHGIEVATGGRTRAKNVDGLFEIGQAIRIARRDVAVDAQAFNAMVLYADPTQLALKYTWEDRVDTGYMVHLANLSVDANLVAFYQRLDAEGRHSLPGVYNDSVVGNALGSEVDVVVRDVGSFLDPRSRQDGWQDQPEPLAWAR